MNRLEITRFVRQTMRQVGAVYSEAEDNVCSQIADAWLADTKAAGERGRARATFQVNPGSEEPIMYHYPQLTLITDAAPVLIGRHWLLSVMCDRALALPLAHNLDVQVQPGRSGSPDFVRIIWRYVAGDGSNRQQALIFHGNRPKPGGLEGTRPVAWTAGAIDSTRTWESKKGKVRYGVSFAMKIEPLITPRSVTGN